MIASQLVLRRGYALPLCCALLSAACNGPAGAGDAAPEAAPPSDAAASDATEADGEAPAPALRDVRYEPPATSRVLEPGVRRDWFFVRAPAPRPTPARADGSRPATPTPEELNRVRVLRYRADVSPPAETRTVFVMMPGFLGGGGSFDGLARALVARSQRENPGGPVEVWAVDRRANNLEDLRGMDAAEANNDPELARSYYITRDSTVNGQRFAGFLEPRAAELAYMAEWGLGVAIDDLKAVVDSVPDPRAHVVLVGHSLGASLVEAFAAWDFAGTPGYRSVAGLVMLDGVLRGARTSEMAYYMGGGTAPGGFGTAPGVAAVRENGPYYFALPLLGVRALAISELVARRALAAPDAVVRDPQRDSLFRTLLGLGTVPPMTNAAAMGFGFDDQSCGLTIAAMSLGQPTGGALTRAPGPLGGMITVPANGTDTYRWIDAPESTPREFTPLRVAAAAWASTPSNFAEWYFPLRLSLDMGLLGDLRVPEDSFAWREGVRAKHGGMVDAPVLAIGAGLVPQESAYEAIRARLSATVGEGRPAAGAPRTDPRAFRIITLPAMTHIDPIVAREAAAGGPDNPIPAALLEFGAAHTTTPTRIAQR